VVASNKRIDELETGLLNSLISVQRCITDDADFIRVLTDTKVRASE